MCGRFAFYSPREAVARLFAVPAEGPEIEPRYNIAPTQYVAAVRAGEPPATRALSMLYWGLVPAWAKERGIGARLINARGETLKEKPAFRSAYRHRRCLILADGYYEWQRSAQGKQPFFIRLASGEPFAIAALWERWRDPLENAELESCTLITTAPAAALAHIHDRMPVIVPAAAYAEWLDPRNADVERLDRLMAPPEDRAVRFHPVSRAVNSARSSGAQLIEPVDPGPTDLFAD
ncbi:MAG TPA: SOS response-associated peptidase [Steroidobacteraceae bacterium]|nr:SOS response-associated peptidase [Steroidobacteraceae bacterium]